MESLIKEKCCGCSACEQICPVEAIKLVPDQEGFLYPQVDEERCTNCGLCQEVCAFGKKLFTMNEFKEPDAYAVKHKDFTIRLKSRSGGCFTALSDYILNLNGYIYGCGLDKDFHAAHRRTGTKEERDSLRGSKYVQSNMGGIFKDVKKDLLDGNYVLFSGTSCQVASLKKYLEFVDQTKLLCVDILCYGVPSPVVWKDYLKFSEKRFHGKITEVSFRDKKDFGWKSHVETMVVNEKKHNSRIYAALFSSKNMIRPSCFFCPYKNKIHPGDITLGDFWGISKAVKGFHDNKGVSLVLINNSKGRKVFDKIKDELEYEKSSVDKSKQRPLRENFPIPKEREKFWSDYRHKSFFQIACKYGKLSKKQFLKEQLTYYKGKLHLPAKLNHA